MKIALAFFLLAAAAVCVYATSEPHCEGVTCDPETCPKHECHCGSHKDACGCCDFCNKCANEECHPEHNDKCAEGHHCVVKAAGDDHGHATGTGHCEPVESSTGHDGAHGHDEAHGHNETHGHDGAHGHDETHGHAAAPDSEAPVQDAHHHAEEGSEHGHSGGDSAHHE